MHQVLEAKLLGPADTVVSIATEFIDNSDAQSVPAGASQEQLKQDCELKALRRLMAGLRGEFPQFHPPRRRQLVRLRGRIPDRERL